MLEGREGKDEAKPSFVKAREICKNFLAG